MTAVQQLPLGVVLPHTIEAAVEAVRVCHEHRLPLVSRGGGTSLAGQCTSEAVVIDFSKSLQPAGERRRRRSPMCRGARHRLRRPQHAARSDRTEIRSRTRHSSELHARRDDRQQVLWGDRTAHRDRTSIPVNSERWSRSTVTSTRCSAGMPTRGFSGRTQIHDLDSGGHEGIHLAEVLKRGLDRDRSRSSATRADAAQP
jgi:FAD binding domain